MAADEAGHAVADADDVAADGLTKDLAIKGRHAFDVAGGNTQDFADGIGGSVRHPATRFLNDLQRLDGSGARVFVMMHFVLDGRALGFAEDETVSLDQSAHISGPRRP